MMKAHIETLFIVDQSLLHFANVNWQSTMSVVTLRARQQAGMVV